MKDIEKEVVDVLTDNPDNIGFEKLQSEKHSPLNQAVKEKDIAGTISTNNWNPWKPEESENLNTKIDSKDQLQNSIEESTTDEGFQEFREPSPLDDVPEQEIDNRNASKDSIDQEQEPSKKEEEFELPTATAKQAADTILGMTNNVLTIGGGFFVKIRKTKEFYEFDEVIKLIDEQNEKNVQRVKLDKEDKALVKPLIVAILKKKAKKLTPEQQLIGAVLSILMKKGQEIIGIRAENEILFDRILDVVREEKGYSDQDIEKKPTHQDIVDAAYEEINGTPEFNGEVEANHIEPVYSETTNNETSTTITRDDMVDTIDDSPR